MGKFKTLFLAHKITFILILALIILGAGGIIAFGKISSKPAGPVDEIDLAFDAEGPYALTFPRRDGNALVLKLIRTSSYDAISYELAYTSNPDEKAMSGNKIISDGEEDSVGGVIDRGVMGTIDTNEKKGEYEQEILFGTCSKNVCKYDKGIENGTLTLHIRKADKAYRMSTQWHLQKPDIALGNLTSGDGHLVFKVDGDRQVLSNIGFTIINDLTGVPKLPSGKSVLGKTYAFNGIITKQLGSGSVSLELADNPPADAKLYQHNGVEWKELDTKIESSKLSSKASGSGIFAVLIPSK